MDEKISFDSDVFQTQFSNLLVRTMVDVMFDDKDKDYIIKTLDIFEKHGVDLKTAMCIVKELGTLGEEIKNGNG